MNKQLMSGLPLKLLFLLTQMNSTKEMNEEENKRNE